MMEEVRRRSNRLITTLSPSSRTALSFDDYVSLYLMDRQLANCSARTVQFYSENLRYLKTCFEEHGTLLDVRYVTVSQLKLIVLGRMLEHGLSSYTINGRLKTYKPFFKFLFKEGYRDDDISSQLLLIKGEQKMIPTLTKQQALQLLNTPDRHTFVGLRDYTVMLILLETGIRLQELTSLQINDVLFSDHELRIRNGKGRKSRRVPFQKTCTHALKAYLKERGDLPTKALFVTLDNQPIKPRTLQENIRQYGHAAGISGVRVSPHTFRHTMAKLYLLSGGDAFTLQHILGHSCLDMVKQYLHFFRSDIQEQHRKFSPVENMKY